MGAGGRSYPLLNKPGGFLSRVFFCGFLFGRFQSGGPVSATVPAYQPQRCNWCIAPIAPGQVMTLSGIVSI